MATTINLNSRENVNLRLGMEMILREGARRYSLDENDSEYLKRALNRIKGYDGYSVENYSRDADDDLYEGKNYSSTSLNVYCEKLLIFSIYRDMNSGVVKIDIDPHLLMTDEQLNNETLYEAMLISMNRNLDIEYSSIANKIRLAKKQR